MVQKLKGYARKRFCGKDTYEKIIGVTVQHHEAVA